MRLCIRQHHTLLELHRETASLPRHAHAVSFSVNHLLLAVEVEAFDVSVLIRLAGLNVMQRDIVVPAPVPEDLWQVIGSIVDENRTGRPHHATRQSRVRSTRSPGIYVSMTISRASLTLLSRNFSVWNRRAKVEYNLSHSQMPCRHVRKVASN